HLLELALEDAVGVFRLLLFAELDSVFALLLAPAGIGSVLAGAVGLALHPLVRSIDRFLELPGDPGLGSCVTCHSFSFGCVSRTNNGAHVHALLRFLLNAALFRWTAAVVGHGGDVDDLGHF